VSLSGALEEACYRRLVLRRCAVIDIVRGLPEQWLVGQLVYRSYNSWVVPLLACPAVRGRRGRAGHHGSWPLYVFSIAIGNGSKLMEGRAAVASAGAANAATTERDPPKS